MTWRVGARSDVGLHRDGNEDSFIAGSRLVVVADGVGGSVAGEIASTLAVQALQPLEADTSITDPLAALGAAIRTANTDLRIAIESDRALAGMGTTLTAMLWSGETLGMAQLGDSRAYRMRAGELQQITKDHTLVQSLVDEGQITAEEALVHPRRSWILRALDGRDESEPDLVILDPQPGDRYLLCSDGLSDYVDVTAIAEALTATDPQDASQRLVDLALKAGAPDNVTCVVADPVTDAVPQPPIVGGAAATARPAPLTTPSPAPHEFVPTGTADEAATPRRPSLTRRLLLVFGLVVVLVVAAGVGTIWWTRSQWYVGRDGADVAIYQGVHGAVLGHRLNRLHRQTDLPSNALSADDLARVSTRVEVNSLSAAYQVVANMRAQACTNAKSRAVAAHQQLLKQRSLHHTKKPVPPVTLPSYCPAAGAS
jgi:protein phosphatase